MRLAPSISPSERIADLLDRGSSLVFACSPCGREDLYDSAALRSRLAGREWLTLGALAPRVRCESCGSRDGEVRAHDIPVVRAAAAGRRRSG